MINFTFYVLQKKKKKKVLRKILGPWGENDVIEKLSSYFFDTKVSTKRWCTPVTSFKAKGPVLIGLMIKTMETAIVAICSTVL